MLPRLLLFILLFLTSVLAEERQMEFLAKEMKSEGNILRANGDVSIHSEGYAIQADKAIYNKSNGQIDLEGDVIVSRHGTVQIRSQNVRMYLDEKSALIEPFYIQDDASGLWISAQKAKLNEENYEFERAVITGCCIDDPLWHIESTNGNYDTNSSWVSIWNPQFYLYDIPIAYLPYFGFSADTNRRSGLLYPSVGLSENEGILYQQPIYFVPSHSWDVEIAPQVRTERGGGVLGRLRFADSEDSSGQFEVGYFKEKGDYHDAYNLKHIEHHGYGFEYENASLLSNYFSDITHDGLYVDVLLLSDREHANIHDISSGGNFEDKVVTSRLNYYLRNDTDYIGMYAKHFFDTSALNNDETLQNYPMLQYHRFTNPLLWDRLLFSVDARHKDYHRNSGLNAIQRELSVPFEISFPLFDEFFSVGYSQSLYLSKIYYEYKEKLLVNSDVEDADFARTFHQINLSSDLIRGYEWFTHQLQFVTEYILPGFKSKDGYFANFITVPDEEEELKLRLSQFYYDPGGQTRVYHRMKQSVYFQDYIEKYSELENEFQFHVSQYFNLGSDVYYSHENSRISVFAPYVNYNTDFYDITLSHYYKNRINDSDDSFLKLSMERNFGSIDLFGTIKYDHNDHEVRWWRAGVSKEKRCWEYTLAMQKKTNPILKKDGPGSLEESFVTFEFKFNPVGGMKQKLHRVDN